MSFTEAKLSQTFHSLNIAGKHFGSNYKVCLGSVFHEKHVFEVCFCLQRFESLQKVECLALARENTISRDILSNDSVVFTICPLVFLTQKHFPNTKTLQVPVERTKTQHRWQFVNLTAVERNRGPTWNTLQLTSWWLFRTVFVSEGQSQPVVYPFPTMTKAGVLSPGLYLPHRQVW